MTVWTETLSQTRIPAKTGKGFVVKRGDLIRITDLEGRQPVDFWALNKDDLDEHLSCCYTKPSIAKIRPQQGDAAYTNLRRPIMTLLLDQSPGQHDMLHPPCDTLRMLELGGTADQPTCEGNLRKAAVDLGINLTYTPQPWNLFTNFVVHSDGSITQEAPDTRPGDHVILRSEMDSYVIVSACPMDLNATCAFNCTDILFEIGR